jgi:GNAT superfamily N-acetyltransferase
MLACSAVATNAFSLRRATPADSAAAARIIATALAEHSLPFEPEGRDADVATFGTKPDVHDLVAEIDGDVVGVVSVAPQDTPGVAWLSKLFVAKRARGHGIGRALLHAAHDAARGAGFHTVGLRTRKIFIEAVGLYTAEGYQPREDPRVIEAGDVVMLRSL